MLLGLSGTISVINLGLKPRGIVVDVIYTEFLPERLSITKIIENEWTCRCVVECCSGEISA